MKILLLSDTTMCANAGGVAQTLYNIFSYIDPKNILCVTTRRSFKKDPPSHPFNNRYITYRYEFIKCPRNRFAPYLDPLSDWINYTINIKYRSFKGIKKHVKHFGPDIVVSCSNSPIGLFMHKKLLKGISVEKVFPYFMDDWLYQRGRSWLGKRIHQSAKEILKENPAWLMISAELSEILSERYDVKPLRFLEIHNPVNLIGAPISLPIQIRKDVKLAYAGSLWDMHFDAFCVIAKSISNIKEQRGIQLILYTSKDQWNWRKSKLEPLGVIYGGSVPYSEIHEKLSKADALILSSSFSKEYYTHSKGSIQTKITDYLKSKRLIISCGPDYSANHNFLKRNNCGICIETNDEVEVAMKLNEIFDNLLDYQGLVINGWKLLESEFSFSKVHRKLQCFLEV